MTEICLTHFFLWLNEEDIEFAEVFNVKMLEIDSKRLQKLKLDTKKMEQIII